MRKYLLVLMFSCMPFMATANPTIAAVTYPDLIFSTAPNAATVRGGAYLFSPMGDAIIIGELRAMGMSLQTAGLVVRLALARLGPIILASLRLGGPIGIGASLLLYLYDNGIVPDTATNTWVLKDSGGQSVTYGANAFKVDSRGASLDCFSNTGARKYSAPNTVVLCDGGVIVIYGGSSSSPAFSSFIDTLGGAMQGWGYYMNANSGAPFPWPGDGPWAQAAYPITGGWKNYTVNNVSAVAVPQQKWDDLKNIPPPVAAAVDYVNSSAAIDQEIPVEDNPAVAGTGITAIPLGVPYPGVDGWMQDYVRTQTMPNVQTAAVSVAPVKIADAGPTAPATPTTAPPAATAHSSSMSEVEVVDPCVDNPKRIGCLELGTPTPEPLTPDEVPFSITPQSPFGSGSAACPAPRTATVMGRSISLSYQPTCDFMSGMRPVVIACALLMALFIAFGFRQGGE